MHRGSMQYWQKRRARKRLPRVRSASKGISEPTFLNFIAYKAGMAHIAMTDDSNSPSKGMEVVFPCTFLETPQAEVYGARFYIKDQNGYRKISTEIHSKEAAKKLRQKNVKKDEAELNSIKGRLNEFEDITALIAAYPKGMSAGQHHAIKFESAIGGNSIEQKFNFISPKLGKEVRIADMLKDGEYVDITSITKGKGWQGPIKRFGVARLYHKATNKIRHVGTLGPFTPGKVLYTVPQAGQMGFNYRTETNKRVLKIGSSNEAGKINPKSGFTNYGNIKNDYIMIKGSVGGPSKRLLRIRKAAGRNTKGIKEPKLNYISINN